MGFTQGVQLAAAVKVGRMTLSEAMLIHLKGDDYFPGFHSDWAVVAAEACAYADQPDRLLDITSVVEATNDHPRKAVTSKDNPDCYMITVENAINLFRLRSFLL